MTVSADINGTLSSVSWSDEQLYLKEFMHRHPLPAVVRIVKGQYCSLGVSSISNPSLQSTILLTNLGKRKRVLGQSIKYKDSNKRVVPVGPKLAIPNSYDGFFELLSEDGRSVRCIESVAELIRRFPDAILVREPLRAFVSKSDDVDTIEEHSRLVQVGETLLLVGEVISNKNRANANVNANANANSNQNQPPSQKQQTKFLRCFDKNGENVYLPCDLKGKFSAIAKEDNISGVHTVDNLMTKRLPVMTRLIHGLPPVGLKSAQAFLPEMRLFSVIEEDFLVAMTLSSNNTAVLPLPLPANLKLQFATNMTILGGTKEFLRLKERCEDLSHHLEDRIVVHDIAIPKDLRINGGDLKQKINTKSPPGIIGVPSNRPRLNNGGFPNHNSDEYDEIEQIYDYVRGFAPLPKTARGWRYEPSSPVKMQTTPVSTDESPNSSDMTPPEPPPLETLPTRIMQKQTDMSVIFSPPPWGVAAYGHIRQNHDNYEPPIPTVPCQSNTITTTTKQQEAKKRQRHSAEKMSKNGHENSENLAPLNNSSHRNSYHHQSSLSNSNQNGTASSRFIKSANYKSMQNHSGSGNANNTNVTSHPSSATTYRQRLFRSNRSSKDFDKNHVHHSSTGIGPSMFQMRYKSMTNLAQTPVAVNSSPNIVHGGEYDTLNSSNSGGKTSGGSSSTRQPEKRSRKLSRPKSLTNLVWGSSREKSASRQSLNAPDMDPMRRLEPGVFGGLGNRRLDHHGPGNSPAHHVAAAAAVFANGKKLGSSKKIGTLYL